MRHRLFSIGLIACLAAVPAAAQDAMDMDITVSDPDAPRATIYAGYGGHGVDWEMAGDSRGFERVVRFRGFVGQGRWVGAVDTRAPARLDPTVTRAGVMLILSESPDDGRALKAYSGLGIA